MPEKRDVAAHPHEGWDADLEAFVALLQASLVLLQPSHEFEEHLRDRLAQAAADLAAQPHKPLVPRVLVFGVAAALSLAGAGAGAAWLFWKTRPHTASLGSFLPARSG
ncbi:MAG: hypothetical protein HY689_13290 [Chloroflexi bacterium]|nr:hypothetical protein [Chloroflexota bacterium]